MARLTNKIPVDSQFGTQPRLHSDDKVLLDSGDAYIPSGSIVINADVAIPAGFLECDGSAVSRTTFSRLFGVLGSRYGSGDGSSTFNLPDLRGEFVRGWDNGRGIDSGRAFGSSQDDELKTHTHSGSTNTTGDHSHTTQMSQDSSGFSNSFFRGNIIAGSISTNTAGDHSHTVSITSTGGSETRPRNIAMMYCIKF